MDEQVNKVSIYKMSENVKDFDECMSVKISKNKIIDINTSSLVGKFYYDEICSPNRKEDMSWIKFFNEKINDHISGEYYNTYPRGIFFYKLKDMKNFYVMSFGLGGDGFINKNKIVFDFGIKVAMNICDPDGLRRVQSSKVEAIALHSEKQINSGARLSIFDIDDEKEFLRKIATKPLPQYSYISVITGSEAVQVKFGKEKKLDWDNLGKITKELNELYFSQKYKDIFKNYDNFKFVNDKDQLKSDLDEVLLKSLRENNTGNVYLTSAVFFDYENFEFSYSKPNKKEESEEIERFSELSLSDCFSRYKIKDTTTVDNLKAWNIYKYDIEKKIFSKLSSVYKCLVAELDYHNSKFILFNGRWRQVDEELQNKISNYFNKEKIKFEEYDDTILLNNVSIWNGKTGKDSQYKESIYNEKCAKANKSLFMFDRAKINYGEMCDLLSLNKEIIHVKRYEKGAASISHLFVQAKYYTDIFISDSEARNQMREFIDNDILDSNKVNYQKNSNKFKDVIPESSPIDTNYTIILCILTEQEKRIIDLPFMAQYEIYQTHKYLTNNRHFRVKFVNRIIVKQQQ